LANTLLIKQRTADTHSHRIGGKKNYTSFTD